MHSLETQKMKKIYIKILHDIYAYKMLVRDINKNLYSNPSILRNINIHRKSFTFLSKFNIFSLTIFLFFLEQHMEFSLVSKQKGKLSVSSHIRFSSKRNAGCVLFIQHLFDISKYIHRHLDRYLYSHLNIYLNSHINRYLIFNVAYSNR